MNFAHRGPVQGGPRQAAGIVIHGKLHIKIQNIVASVILGGKVDLEGFYEVGGKIGLGGRMIYEPEQFPGLIYRMEDPRRRRKCIRLS